MVAGFRPAKNHLRLVEAMAMVARSGVREGDVVVLLAGDGPTRAQVESEIRRRGLQPYFRFLGNVPHGWQVIASADAAVLTSDREGLPVVAMEAIAAGRPVLSTRVGGVPELVDHGRSGLLFGTDAASAADAIGRFVADADLRARLRRHARDRQQDVDIRRTVAEMERIYGVGGP